MGRGVESSNSMRGKIYLADFADMHIQQTKRESRVSGGPQYYFHNLTDAVKIYLRKKQVVPLALVTPYGATKTTFYAISKDTKLNSKGEKLVGKVGHDRIQQGSSSNSIGEAIRFWYNLSRGDFERIDIEVDILDYSFYIVPTICKQVAAKRSITIDHIERPLTFTSDYISKFWKDQISAISRKDKELVKWSFDEISQIANDHINKVPHIQEPDLLRACGALKHLGISLGAYVGKGYDCKSFFQFDELPEYSVPVEIKRFSKGFHYQMKKYGKDELSRAVILCAQHDLTNVHKNIDVIELSAFSQFRNSL